MQIYVHPSAGPLVWLLINFKTAVNHADNPRGYITNTNSPFLHGEVYHLI